MSVLSIALIALGGGLAATPDRLANNPVYQHQEETTHRNTHLADIFRNTNGHPTFSIPLNPHTAIRLNDSLLPHNRHILAVSMEMLFVIQNQLGIRAPPTAMVAMAPPLAAQHLLLCFQCNDLVADCISVTATAALMVRYDDCVVTGIDVFADLNVVMVV